MVTKERKYPWHKSAFALTIQSTFQQNSRNMVTLNLVSLPAIVPTTTSLLLLQKRQVRLCGSTKRWTSAVECWGSTIERLECS